MWTVMLQLLVGALPAILAARPDDDDDLSS
jgi:hypothetical protein